MLGRPLTAFLAEYGKKPFDSYLEALSKELSDGELIFDIDTIVEFEFSKLPQTIKGDGSLYDSGFLQIDACINHYGIPEETCREALDFFIDLSLEFLPIENINKREDIYSENNQIIFYLILRILSLPYAHSFGIPYSSHCSNCNMFVSVPGTKVMYFDAMKPGEKGISVEAFNCPNCGNYIEFVVPCIGR